MWTADDYLAHHGILGQKHGKRNGPPYPLKPGDHSASERKAGWRKSLTGNGKNKTAEEYATGTHKVRAKDLSDDELKDYIRRDQLEKTYNKITGQNKSKLDSAREAINNTGNIARQLKSKNEESMRAQTYKPRMDLSKMTNKELQDAINRENLELQYNRLFAEEKSTVTKGQRYANDILETVGAVAAIAGSAIGIAVSIKQLRGK